MWVMRMTCGKRSARLRSRSTTADAPVLVQRAEDLVQHQERERLPGALGDHLADGEAQREVRDVLLAAGDDRLGIAVVQEGGAVVLVQLQLGVAPVGEVPQEGRRQVGEVGPKGRVQLAPEIGEGAVELLVQAEISCGRGRVALPCGPFLTAALGDLHRLGGRAALPSRPRQRHFRLAPDSLGRVGRLLCLAMRLLAVTQVRQPHPQGGGRLHRTGALARGRGQLFADDGGALAHHAKALGLERQRLQGANPALEIPVAALVIVRRVATDRGLELSDPSQETLSLLVQRAGLLELRLEPAELGSGDGQFALQLDATPVELVQLRWLVLQLLDPLLVVVPVGDDLVHLAVEQAEHVLVLGAQRPGAGGAVAGGPGLHQPLPLIPQLLIVI